MLLTDFDRSRDALDTLERIVRKDPIRVMCKACERMFIRTLLTPHVCPYCGSDQ